MLVGFRTPDCPFGEIKNSQSQTAGEASGSLETRWSLFRREIQGSIKVGSTSCKRQSDVLFFAPVMVYLMHN